MKQVEDIIDLNICEADLETSATAYVACKYEGWREDMKNISA